MESRQQLEEFNRSILQWGFRTRNIIKGRIGALSMAGKGDLVRSLKMSAKKTYGEIDRVIFSFDRHGAFFHKGVGRGHIIVAGRVIRGHRKDGSKHGSNTLDNTVQYDTLKPVRRHPKQWFTPVFEKEMPALADLITKAKADSILDEKTFNLRT